MYFLVSPSFYAILQNARRDLFGLVAVRVTSLRYVLILS